MLYKCPKDANDIEAPLLISLAGGWRGEYLLHILLIMIKNVQCFFLIICLQVSTY